MSHMPMDCSLVMHESFILVSDWYPNAFFPSVHIAFNLFGPFPKKLAPEKDLQGPLCPSSKIFWLNAEINQEFFITLLTWITKHYTLTVKAMNHLVFC